MKKTQKAVAFALANLVVMVPISQSVFAAGVPASAASSSAAFIQDIKTFQAGIDSGSVKPADAIDAFSKSITDQQISLNDVNSVVQSQMTTEQFAAYQAQMNSELRGIDPSSLTPEETGQLVGQALDQIHTEGLYWNGCESTWTGAAIAVAAIVVGVTAIAKSKSVSAIQSDYQNQIAQNNSAAQANITATNNWQTAFPKEISADENDINARTADIESLSAEASEDANSGNTSAAQGLDTEIDGDSSAIQSDDANIAYLQSKISEYTANPAQASVDAQTIASNEAKTDASLQAQETAAVAAAPANQKEGMELGIGAGLGAAVSAVLLYKGYEDSGLCGMVGY